MKRFNPTAPARATIGEGLILQSAGRPLFKKLATRADLSVGSQQLVVGGIGSGKTTELILAERELTAYEQILTVYVDISAETDLSALNSGSLLASLGMHVWEMIESRFEAPPKLSKVYEGIRTAAYGHQKQIWVEDWANEPPDYEPDDEEERPGHYETVHVVGKLKPPFPAIRRDVKELGESIRELTAFLKSNDKEVVVLFDGLDRLINVDKFWSVAEQDLRAIKSLEVSVLAAGPLSVMYGHGRQIKDYFDEVHYIPPAIADPKKSSFLFEILRLRQAEELMNRKQMQRLCLASGGVLRDLISLARTPARMPILTTPRASLRFTLIGQLSSWVTVICLVSEPAKRSFSRAC